MVMIKNVAVHHTCGSEVIKTVHIADIKLTESEYERIGSFLFINNSISADIRGMFDLTGFIEYDNYLGKIGEATLNIYHSCCTNYMRCKLLEQFL